jgi:hypothetical protein
VRLTATTSDTAQVAKHHVLGSHHQAHDLLNTKGELIEGLRLAGMPEV